MNRAFKILIAAVFINLCVGVLYAWSVISRALVNQMGWSNAEAGLPYTIAVVTFALGVLAAGNLQDRMGPQKLVITGVGMVGLGMLASSMATTPFALLMTFGVLVGTGIGFAYACLSPTAMKWFHPSKKGMVNGLIAGGFGMAPLYLAPLSSALILSMGVSATFMALGVAVLVIGLPLAFTIVTPPAGYQPEVPAGYNEPAGKAASRNFTWREMVRTRQFYLMWIAFAFASSAGLMLIGNITSIASIQGNKTDVAYLVSLLAVANTLGRILMGMLSDKIGRTPTLLLAVAMQTANMLMFPYYTGEAGFIAGAIVAGVSYGALLSVFPSMTADYFGIKNYGSNFGVLYLAWGASGFMGPVMAGIVVDATGGYGLAYSISAVMLAIAGAAAFFTKPVNVDELEQKGILKAA
ncbi:oxalate:formate antiporter [Endozoicomonas montiporae]|uniref:Oxalate:formate antiporter n=2 Tax=Endozoicomonas montiporae TaxID=1027273 RepID=A0A081N2G6_9GAMM|nr:OFA family MFS transporter [Endozoicomonas montiporae]AMO58394.1 major facilitator superfamily protein [Endozoicomonas montiporae CL-33]KEQ12639.1 oxalate:formate antiporter [Endozoicomonas montiporae]